MSINKYLRSYILEEEFKITILNNKINIVNYTSLGTFDDSTININYNNGSIIIKGSNLVVSRLMNNEILISGNINSLEFR